MDKQSGPNVQEMISSDLLERAINGCTFMLMNTLKLSPLGTVMVLQEAAAFVSKRNGIMGVGTPIHADTGMPIEPKPHPREGREL